MDDNLTKVIIAVVGLFGAFVGGKLIFRSKNKKRNITQKNITITGKGNKVIGGDDNSKQI
ncbi:hypothetical protein [Elizabethkingia anophelis]|uniref:hypothetical protein n=1 Tax=Elizabethkingia anophelis TaxID=1117645 RepID=UPI001367DA0D|nr:hypothetical protein [Elizabethkingia anophelis]MCT4142351.1 hypothetical protein [Elizabethkingia anophelis]MCT4277957.1 hypothetical protein [Elizabethkingia anophelis]MCT4281371.1 hypothetical protein [Elizabethkingia anophelis]MCT4306066.1 hypothetical protein [Elizabethkingia anophelis]MYY44176.1 hypothetical protein [Elizabethkingia anophelis]